MTRLLEQAFQEASKLPDIEQNILAKWVLEELESDHQWDQKFAQSEDLLSQMADDALAEEQADQTSEIDIEKL